MHFRPIGKIVKTHGLEGSLFIIVKDLNSDYMCSLKYLFFGTGEKAPDDTLELLSINPHGKGYRIRVKGIDHISNAEKLLKCTLFLPVEQIPVDHPEDIEIIGFKVLDSDRKETIGTVAAMETYPAHKMLIVRTPEGKEIMIPAVDEFITEISYEEKYVLIVPQEGLLDDH